MKVESEKYSNKKICVAVSGGKDSMALLHYLSTHAKEFGITLSALNCDHGIRGEQSARDSQFVMRWCEDNDIPLIFFKHCGSFLSEGEARSWRIKCYSFAAHGAVGSIISQQNIFPDTIVSAYSFGQKWQGVDCIATAHHLNDNAETILFNLARGSSLSGLNGITDGEVTLNDSAVYLIRPFIQCSRADIDNYINTNGIPYVEDDTNFSDDYTRNYIRHNVLPSLEKAVPGACKAIYRFSRLAADDEEYFSRQTENLITATPPYGYAVSHCGEKVIFKRAAVKIITGFGCKDYTSEQAQRLFDLQFAKNGKKFSFLGLTAYKEEGKIVIVKNSFYDTNGARIPLSDYIGGKKDFCGQVVCLSIEGESAAFLNFVNEACGNKYNLKPLRFDLDKIPEGSYLRTYVSGDKFTKFGGGTKSLGDYFTDCKIPLRLRPIIPLVVSREGEVLAVCGVEISDKIKLDGNTKNVGCIICADYKKL